MILVNTLKYLKVERGDEFWLSKMESFLTRFYMECLRPEIVDGRRKRSMPIRDPVYIQRAKQEWKGWDGLIGGKKPKRKRQESYEKNVKLRRQKCRRDEISAAPEDVNAENCDDPRPPANVYDHTESPYISLQKVNRIDTVAIPQPEAITYEAWKVSSDKATSKMD